MSALTNVSMLSLLLTIHRHNAHIEKLTTAGLP